VGGFKVIRQCVTRSSVRWMKCVEQNIEKREKIPLNNERITDWPLMPVVASLASLDIP